MADENNQEVEATEEPQGEAKAKTDWKAEARKWEALAKKGKAAEDELAKLKEAQMTEQEKANARAEKAEAELAEMRAEAERLSSARQISQAENVPFELLEFCSSKESMEEFCKVYRQTLQQTHAAASGVRIVKEGTTVSNRDRFAAFADEQLNRR